MRSVTFQKRLGTLSRMLAVRCHRWMPYRELEIEDVPVPEVGPDQVRIAVHCAGMSFAGWWWVFVCSWVSGAGVVGARAEDVSKDLSDGANLESLR